jgi:ABC-type hemin transport system ATPase subunit
MQRVVILGRGGAGKSTFAQRLGPCHRLAGHRSSTSTFGCRDCCRPRATNGSRFSAASRRKTAGSWTAISANTTRLTDHPPDIVVLNSCESSAARKTALRSAKIVITMRVPVTDVAATAFAQRFYAAIASGQSVKSAFARGRVAVENVSISEVATPELFHAVSTNPEKMILT